MRIAGWTGLLALVVALVVPSVAWTQEQTVSGQACCYDEACRALPGGVCTGNPKCQGFPLPNFYGVCKYPGCLKDGDCPKSYTCQSNQCIPPMVPLSSTVEITCHCDPDGKKSSDWPLGRVTKDRVKAVCSQCNNDFCRKKTRSSNIKHYTCRTK